MPEQETLSVQTEQPTIKLIFVVDDDKEIGTLIVQVIEQETPHRVHHHLTGTHALQAITTHTPHLFILDYSLPDMDGLELHDRLHAVVHLKDTPTLLMSAQKPPMREVRQRKITFLPKPFEITHFLHAVGTLLNEGLL
jgi:CheY-like chemotaxis protein